MYLSKKNIQTISASTGLELPSADLFLLPEKVLQFGTGVLLRGLPDFIIDRANKKDLFNGRIVMVKSTDGDTDAFDKQDGLYTVCIRGIAQEKQIEENHIVSSVSRVLAAATNWNAVLETAANPHMQVIISNTTEIGISLTEDNIHATPPKSFPGKLLSFLYRRFKIFNGDITKGMVVIPTELIPGNADKLLAILKELLHQNDLEKSFLDWLENANYFCNSLVDRIVPGKLNNTEQKTLEQSLGFNDELLIMAEKYALWAIQTDHQKVKEILSFASEDEGVIIADDISKFRELKLRLLNGPHTFCCGLAWLSGFKTVKEAMGNDCFSEFIKSLMFDEIIPSITSDIIDKNEAEIFSIKVLDRFRNNFINHQWLSICMQYSSKMRLRNVDVIRKYFQRLNEIPLHMTMGMAAHILFMKTEQSPDGKFYGNLNESLYLVEDQNASIYSGNWKEFPVEVLVHKILSNEQLWGFDLSTLPGFELKVFQWLQMMVDKGVMFTLQQHSIQKMLPPKNSRSSDS